MQQHPLEGEGDDRPPANERGGYPPDLAELRREVFRRDGYRCRLCGQQGGPQADGETVKLHAHYTIPPAEGGSSSLDNLITLCDPCHERHHASQEGESDDAETGPASGGSSVAGLVVSWGTLLVLSFLSVTALSWSLGDPLVDLSQYVALAGAGILLALSLRLFATWHQTATAATAATVGTWAVVFYGTDELGTVVGTAEPTATFLVVAAFAVVPYALNRQLGVEL